MLRRVVWYKLTEISEVLTASIVALMMETVSTSGASVSFYQTTRRNIPEDSNLHTRRREDLKSHKLSVPQKEWKSKTYYSPKHGNVQGYKHTTRSLQYGARFVENGSPNVAIKLSAFLHSIQEA
jgi:hypothetical protein